MQFTMRPSYCRLQRGNDFDGIFTKYSLAMASFSILKY